MADKKETAKKPVAASPKPDEVPAKKNEVKPVAPAFKKKRRHRNLILSFLIFVCVPIIVSIWYLYERAADQYSSTAGFVVRTTEVTSPAELLGGIANVSSGGSDSDILYEFIRSQELIRRIDENLDLKALYNKPENDPIFTLGSEVTIEDILKYWRRAVKVSFDPGSGLIELRVLAFDPEDAQAIANEIFVQSTKMINDLSTASREDATRYARIELDGAAARLKQTRLQITNFRNTAQIVDPEIDLQGQMGLLNSLQQQLAETTIELDLIEGTTRTDDPRVRQAKKKIEVIELRIEEQKGKIGLGSGGTGEAYSTLFGTYEGLIVEKEFAEQAYQGALANYDAALSEANRQTRYLAAYIKPTLAERPEYPQRFLLIALLGIICLLVWTIFSLIIHSLLDRR